MSTDVVTDGAIRTDLELTGEDWTGDDGRIRILLVALNIPGYYSLPVRILSLVAAEAPALAGWDCRYVEAEVFFPTAPLAERIARWAPDVVGLSVNIWNRNETFALAALLKKLLPNVKILAGGQEMTHSVVDYLATTPALDYIIDGEGEIPFREFLEAWDPHQNTIADVRRVSGLRYRNSGEVLFTGPARIVFSLDEVPSAVLAGLVPVRGKDKLGVLLEGARGCPYRCAFCFEGGKRGGVRMSSVQRLSSEASRMAQLGKRYFHIMDPILCNGSRERLQQISDFFLRLKNEYSGVVISVEAYAEHITEEVAPHLKAFAVIDIGLQTTNPETVKAIHRHFVADKFRRGIDLLRQIGRRVNIYLILGLPYETPLSFLKGLDFVLGEFPVKLFINELCLLNGTELRHRADEYGYDYSEEPPYLVSATPWFPRHLLSLFRQLSKDLEWSYNLSMQSLYADLPWFANQSVTSAQTHTLWMGGGCAHACPGCQSAGQSISKNELMAALNSVTPNSDVDLLVGEQTDMDLLYAALGQLHLAGVARIRLVAPPLFFRDRDRLVESLSRNVWHIRTFLPLDYAPGQAACARPEVQEALEVFRHLQGIVPLRKRGEVRPYYEVVVDGKSLALEEARALWNFVNTLAFTALTIGEDFLKQENSEAYAEMFQETIERGKWLRLPRDVFKKSVLADDEISGYVEKFGMMSRAGAHRPCFASKVAGHP